MTIAHSHSTPPCDSQADDSARWPVIARFPDLSAEARPAQRPPRPHPEGTRPARPTGRRFDAPQPRGAAAPPSGTAESRSETGTHAAHLPQPPAHHLNQRTARFTTAQTTLHDRAPVESPVLPDWNPFSIPGKRLPDALAPILSFLVMVALFTAVGTSILMLRNGHEPSAPDVHPATRIEQSASTPTAPTAVGPLGATASRLVPSPPDEATTIATPTLSQAGAPATDMNAANSDGTAIRTAPEATTPAADKDFPANEFLEPIFPPTIEVDLPQAATINGPLPVARFSGQILEAPTRQAQHDDQSSVH